MLSTIWPIGLLYLPWSDRICPATPWKFLEAAGSQKLAARRASAVDPVEALKAE
jgi:hypothetical protein